jgi:hypothetical protein
MGTLHKDPCTFIVTSRPILCRMRDVSEQSVEKHKGKSKHTYFCLAIFFKSWLLWDNVEKYRKDVQSTYDTIIRHVRFDAR